MRGGRIRELLAPRLSFHPETGAADPRSIWQWAALAGVLLLAAGAYWPGLSGGFLFDDYVNLDALGHYGHVDNWPVFWRYVTAGTADPTGRPLAMLSFLIDARQWPADPGPFLRTNLLIHLCNGVLLFLLIRQLQRVLGAAERSQWLVALLATAFWLLHPLFVSTTLYVVQRQAMLPATFTLLGLLAYGAGRIRLSERGDWHAQAMMLAGIGIGTVLAVLSKANGVLLPLLAAVLEWAVFARLPIASRSTAKRLRILRVVLLVLPVIAVSAYLASFLPGLGAWSEARGFTPGQRLMTQPRVLLDYLQLLAVPRAMSTGLFNDDYAVSTGLLSPPSTLPALLALVALIGIALVMRRRAPALSAALLFFFAGHLLESSVINLELYFEHRNYLPAMLLGWPLARALHGWPPGKPMLRTAIACALILLLAFTTFSRASLWGKPEQLASLWALRNADSSRAQSMAAIEESSAGRPDLALSRLEPMWRAHPHDLGVAFNYVDARCQVGGLDPSDRERLAEALARTSRSELLTYQWLGNAIEVATAGSCPGLGLEDVAGWIESALRNPVISTPRVRDQDIEPLLGQLALARRQPDEALRHFDRALLATPSPDVAARQAAQLATSGYYESALRHLETYDRVKQRIRPARSGMPWVHARVFAWQGYWPREMTLLRQRLHEAIRERDGAK